MRQPRHESTAQRRCIRCGHDLSPRCELGDHCPLEELCLHCLCWLTGQRIALLESTIRHPAISALIGAWKENPEEEGSEEEEEDASEEEEEMAT